MPMYQFKCSKGHDYEEMLPMDEYAEPAKCPICKNFGERVFALRQSEPSFTEKLYSSGNGYYDVGLGRVFHSERERKSFMQENGYRSKGSEKTMTAKQERFMYSKRMSNKPQM